MAKSTTGIGRLAESAVAKYLAARDYKILDQNWHTRQCEIDIVAEKSKSVYFIEVKYRIRDNQGSGVDYITAKKLKQMIFAGEVWVAQNSWMGDWRLEAADVSGDKFEKIKLIPID